MALGYQHTHEPLPDPRQQAPGLPEDVCRIVARGASKEPADRYQSCRRDAGRTRSVAGVAGRSAADGVGGFKPRKLARDAEPATRPRGGILGAGRGSGGRFLPLPLPQMGRDSRPSHPAINSCLSQDVARPFHCMDDRLGILRDGPLRSGTVGYQSQRHAGGRIGRPQRTRGRQTTGRASRSGRCQVGLENQPEIGAVRVVSARQHGPVPTGPRLGHGPPRRGGHRQGDAETGLCVR